MVEKPWKMPASPAISRCSLHTTRTRLVSPDRSPRSINLHSRPVFTLDRSPRSVDLQGRSISEPGRSLSARPDLALDRLPRSTDLRVRPTSAGALPGVVALPAIALAHGVGTPAPLVHRTPDANASTHAPSTAYDLAHERTKQARLPAPPRTRRARRARRAGRLLQRCRVSAASSHHASLRPSGWVMGTSASRVGSMPSRQATLT